MVTKERRSKSILTFATHSKSRAKIEVSYTLRECWGTTTPARHVDDPSNTLVSHSSWPSFQDFGLYSVTAIEGWSLTFRSHHLNLFCSQDFLSGTPLPPFISLHLHGILCIHSTLQLQRQLKTPSDYTCLPKKANFPMVCNPSFALTSHLLFHPPAIPIWLMIYPRIDIISGCAILVKMFKTEFLVLLETYFS